MGAWTFIFPPYEDKPEDFVSVLDHAKRAGYEGIEVGWFAPHPDIADLKTRAQRERYRELFRERGLGIAGVVGNFDGVPSILTSSDNSPYLTRLDEQLQICAELSIGMLRLDLVDAPEAMDSLDYEQAYERLVSTWSAAARHGAEHGVRIGWEFEPGTPFNKPSEIIRIANEITEPNFGIIYDTTQAHNCTLGLNQRGDVETLPGGQVELLKQLKGKITHIHIIDSNGTLFDNRWSRHIPFGEGDVDWNSVMPALIAAGSRDEWWTVDVCWWENAWPVFEQGFTFVDDLRRRYAD
jgi:sugar phosphate isomerase/epimerase